MLREYRKLLYKHRMLGNIFYNLRIAKTKSRERVFGKMFVLN